MDHPDAVPRPSAPLVLRGREVGRDGGAVRPVVMAVLNRTTDSFYAPARVPDDAAALAVAERAYADGAEILDVGGVRAGTGEPVDEAEEIRRVVPFVAAVRAAVPDLLVSVDTWRAGVARAAIDAGADLINDTWAGHDPELVEVAGAAGVGVVCSHTGGAVPRTDPYRVEYPGPDGLLRDVVATLRRSAERAVACGVPRESVLVDPTHDFGKNTWHSLELLRRTGALAGLGFPCSWRCPARTSWGRRSTCRRRNGWRAPSPRPPWRRGSARGCSARTTCGRRAGCWTSWRPCGTRPRRPPRCVAWPDARRRWKSRGGS
nr:hypothetical protein GCM10025730_19100 [Promicromonospora thailandica]